MRIMELKKGELLAARSDKVMEWYLIQKGSILQKFELTDIKMEANSIIGLLENGWFICDYVANEDCSLIVIPCKDATDLQKILAEHEEFRSLFLRSAILQRQQAFELYKRLSTQCYQLHSYAENFYSEYQTVASEAGVAVRSFARIETFMPIHMTHEASDWEVQSSNSLINKYFSEFIQLMMKDDALCVGTIMEAGAQTRRVTQGIEEMVNYLLFNRDLFFAESGDDILHLFYDLARNIYKEKKDTDRVDEDLQRIVALLRRLKLYTEEQVEEARELVADYRSSQREKKIVDVHAVDCVSTIMKYAGFEKKEIEAFKESLQIFCLTKEKDKMDTETTNLRKTITDTFYKVYEKAFLRSAEEAGEPDILMSMFFYFGFMDKECLGNVHLDSLINYAERINMFRTSHIMTGYDWLLRIYQGKEEPSKNELDQDYNAYLLDLKKNGKIMDVEMATLKMDRVFKVQYEIRNMFRVGPRATSGRASGFVPVLMGSGILNSVERMAMTAERLTQAINEIRRVDYQAFFHEIQFTDPLHGIRAERIRVEILPNIILLPSAGDKGMLWQETAGIRSNTPARLLVPILGSMDINDHMIELIARYRWDYCRHIMGARWNDIREQSLTAEYNDYLQFIRKNRELTQEGRDKVRGQLSAAKNVYREVFVKDYFNWVKYESRGGFRLNKVARAILVRYCPFAQEIRDSLNLNPIYQNAFRVLNSENAKSEQRLLALYDKYEKAGGTITPELKENLKFYQM